MRVEKKNIKIFWTILKVEQEETQINRQNDKKIDGYL